VKKKLNFLIVDDEPNVCECLRLLLAMDGHTAVLANSGMEGLAEFKPGRFDIVCTDFSMPGMQGDQFAAAVKSISPSQPVVMISGLANTMQKPKAVDCLIGKPFLQSDLRNAFQQVMSEKEDAVEAA
jgi:Response regulator containing CheY-like receiver, AAA-type ATPase, and DNA-binding domains